MSKLSWKEAIIKVLTLVGEPMHVREITERIMADKLVETKGATPRDTVSSQITSSIKSDGEKSPFFKVAKGTYGLRTTLTAATQKKLVVEPEDDTTIIRSFGMYWSRAQVVWKSNTALLGRQLQGADMVDFSGQRGVYILYDGHRPIYSGKTAKDRLGVRLLEHTKDRMASRWDRFSWFGLLEVTDDAKLKPVDIKVDNEALIQILEAVLIEVLEPPLNRRRGDTIEDNEYIQVNDPNIKKRLVKEALDDLL